MEVRVLTHGLCEAGVREHASWRLLKYLIVVIDVLELEVSVGVTSSVV